MNPLTTEAGRKEAAEKFTPGDWKSVRNESQNDCTAGWVVTDEEPIARVENSGDLDLMTASKKMYEALASIEQTISDLVKFNSTAVITKQQGEAILQALAKARGKTTTQR